MPNMTAKDVEGTQQATQDREITQVTRVNGKWKARFSVRTVEWETLANYEQIFDSPEEFMEFATGFFDLQGEPKTT
jgi:hypothetical protein